MIQALQRFTSRRGKMKILRSDNGTNFIHARKYMIENDIKWYLNTPAASHHGGVWERMIRSARKVLTSVLTNHDECLDDEQLLTATCAAEVIINDRPMTNNPSSPLDLQALTPNHLLLLRYGNAHYSNDAKDSIYGRRWRIVQQIADSFWKRWAREYLPLLQLSQKPLEQRPLKQDQLVLLMGDSSARGKWPMGRIVEVIEGRDGLVRSIKVRTARGIYTRPVTKVVALEEV